MSRVPTESFHLAEYLEEEMQERGWSLDDLAFRMCGIDPKEWAVTRLAIEFFMEIREPNVILGEPMGTQLGKAFGVSPEFLNNLHEAWRKSNGLDPATAPATADKSAAEAKTE